MGPTASRAVRRTLTLVVGKLPRVARLRPRPSFLRLISRIHHLPAARRSAGHGSVAAGLLVACGVVGLAATPFAHGAGGQAAARSVHPTDPPAARRPLVDFVGAGQTPLALPPASEQPAPPPPAVAAAPPLRKHEIFGFAPYWTLNQSPGFDLHDLTTLAYFALGIAPDGSVQQSGDGWDGYNSQDLASLIDRAHASGSRVVLTVNDFDDAQIHQLLTTPGTADRLAAQLTALIRAKNMDGANLDVEATGGGDRAAFVPFVTQVARTLHAANPHWQVTVDTYAGSAADPSSFFDVEHLAPAVDALFVMAYDMYGGGAQAQPNAPLQDYQFNDTDAMSEYTAVMPAGKVLLGTPFYGYDWQTTSNQPNASTVGDPQPMTYADIQAAAHPVHWDPRSSTPFTVYQAGDGSWHETYYDNPQSLALKAQLVNQFHIRGLGVWALGMDGNDPAMMAALLGHAAPLKAIIGGGSTPKASSSASHSSSSSSSSSTTSSSTTSSASHSSSTSSSSTTSSSSSSSSSSSAAPLPPPPTAPPLPSPSMF